MVKDEEGKNRKAGQVAASYSGLNHIPLLSILIRSLIHHERSFLSSACRKLEKGWSEDIENKSRTRDSD